MIEVEYTSNFVRELKKLDPELLEEVIQKVGVFKDRKNHKVLKVHKLYGKLRGKLSFSINYKYRIVFRYVAPQVASLLSMGDHDIYK